MHDKSSPVNPHQFHPNLFIEGDFLVAESDNSPKPVKVARRTEVTQRKRNVDLGTIDLVLRYLDSDSVERTACLPRDTVFTKRGVGALQALGVDVPEFLAKVVQQFLRDSELKAETINVHTSLGWALNGDQLDYRHATALSGTSVYHGPLNVRPGGTLDGQRAWLTELVLGFAPTEFAVAIALAAPVLGLLRRTVPMESLPVHLHHDSSKGKTTALQLMLSLGGSPDAAVRDGVRYEGLMRSLNATDNALLAWLRGVHGLLVGFDETGALSIENLTPIVFRLAEGKEKGRLNRDSVLRATDTWSTVIVTTGEYPLSARMRRTTGGQVRLIEIGGVQWTKDAAHADAIKAAVGQHYGHIVPAFARHLLDQQATDLVARWRVWQAWCLARLKADPFASRLADRYALILLAGEMAAAAIDLPLDVEGRIWPLLLQANLATADQRDLAQLAMERLQEAVARHSSRFPISAPIEAGREIWGRIAPQDDGTHALLVFPADFARLLKDGGIEDAETVKELWRSRGWLDCEEGKFTRKHRMVSLMEVA
jgi:hypothetical protein